AAAQLPRPVRPPVRTRAQTGRAAEPVLRRLALLGVALVLVAIAAVAVLLLRPAPSIARQVAEPADVVVVVGEGETVWDVVAPHVPAGGDRAAYVAEVVAANGIDAREIAPGTALVL